MRKDKEVIRMNLKWLELFCYIIEEGSISAAARKAFISQPSVTKYIHELEEYYGSILFIRGNGSVIPTESGESLYLHAKPIIHQIENSLEAIQYIESKVQKQLNIGASYTLGEYIIPSVVALFKEKQPNLELQVTINNTRSILGMVENQEVDVAFVEGNVVDNNLTKHVVIEDEVVLIVSPTHPLAGSSGVRISELQQHAYIAREKQSSTRTIVEKQLKEKVPSLVLVPHMELNTTQAIKSAVQNELGYGFASSYSVKNEIANGSLHQVPVLGCNILRPFWTVQKPLRFKKPSIHEFQKTTENFLKWK